MTQVLAVRDWLVSRLLGDAALVGLLGADGDAYAGVYDESAPEGAPYPYIVIGGTEDTGGGSAFGAQGRDGLESIGIHTRPAAGERPGSARAREIYQHLHALLDGTTATLDGGAVLWNCKLRLVTTFLESDRLTTTAATRFTFNTMTTT